MGSSSSYYSSIDWLLIYEPLPSFWFSLFPPSCLFLTWVYKAALLRYVLLHFPHLYCLSSSQFLFRLVLFFYESSAALSFSLGSCIFLWLQYLLSRYYQIPKFIWWKRLNSLEINRPLKADFFCYHLYQQLL